MSRFNTGNPLGSNDPRDLDDNAKNMDLAVNSDGDTFQDRLGRSRLTWAGVVRSGTGDPAIAVDAAARAEAAASQVEQDAEQIAQDAAQQAVDNVVAAVDGAVDRADDAADRAEAAADAAFINADVYPDVASGRAAVADGEQFQVVEGDEIVRYRRDSPSAQTEVARYPSASVSANALRSRAVVIGRVTSVEYSTTGVATIAITEPGYIYVESNSGAPYAVIAPLAESTILPSGQGLIVDLDTGPFDEFGRVIPQVAAIASNAQLGWQSGNRWVILAAGRDSPYIVSGLYSMAKAEAERGVAIAQYARAKVVGTYLVENVNNSGAVFVSLGEGRILAQDGLGGIKTVAPVATTALARGAGFVVDLDTGPIDGQGRYIPQTAMIASSTGWQTGNRYILVANGAVGDNWADTSVVDRVFGEYKRALSGAFDGAVAWQQLAADPMPSWDAATRTLTWPNTFFMVDGFSTRINLAAGSIVFPPGGFWVALLDLASVVYNANNTLPAESVVIKTYGAGGWNGTPGRYLPLFVVGFNCSYPVRFLPVRGSTTWPSGDGTAAKKEGLLIVSDGSGEVRIYQPGSNPSSDGAVEIVYARALNAERGADVWRLNGIYAATRSGNSASRVRQVCNSGEIELAILIKDKSDFMGGQAHGDEIAQWVRMLINGVETSLDAAGVYEAETVEFLQESRLFEPDTVVPQSNHVATAWKRVTINADDVEISTRVEWLQSFELDLCFLSMLPALRDAVGGESIKITTKGFRAPYWGEEDVSESGHTRITTKTDFIKLSGPSGYGMEMQILEGWDKPNRSAFISESATYNKLYFDFTGSGYVTEVGEVMTVKSRFRVHNSN